MYKIVFKDDEKGYIGEKNFDKKIDMVEEYIRLFKLKRLNLRVFVYDIDITDITYQIEQTLEIQERN